MELYCRPKTTKARKLPVGFLGDFNIMVERGVMLYTTVQHKSQRGQNHQKNSPAHITGLLQPRDS